MTGDVIIRAEGLGKKYTIRHETERQHYKALRDVVAHTARNMSKWAVDAARGRAIVRGEATEEFWALKDVNFEVKRGEVLGIIGRNGAGKSTLLKILSRITEPSAGRVTIAGRVASLLEVGTGFHPELTGRENIFLNGAILGMARAEIRRKFDEIVDFSGVEKFIDTPVKYYSSGMYLRLAFAVAAHLDPEILVIDEVLAVGDAAFQERCLGKMQDVAGHGRTVLFVSHNMSAMERLCSRALLLDNGSVRFGGAANAVVAAYLSTMEHGVLEYVPEHDPLRPAEVRRILLCDEEGKSLKQVTTADNPILRIELFLRERLPALKVAFVLHDLQQNPLFASCPPDDGVPYPKEAGHYTFEVKFPIALLMPRRYSITVSLHSLHCEVYHTCRYALAFEVLPAAFDVEPDRMGVMRIRCSWSQRALDELGARIA